MIKKSLDPKPGVIKKIIPPDGHLKFSMKYFDNEDSEMCPPIFANTYTQALMGRLKELSRWTPRDFEICRHKAWRIHTHNWTETSRPDGFKHLPEDFRSLNGWQFQLSANEHGRVHGFLLNDTFYIVWLDSSHRLYP